MPVSALQIPLALPRESEASIDVKRARSLARGNKAKAACLFSSTGIGELGIDHCGIEIVSALELIPWRVALYRENFPNSEVIEGDIWEQENKFIQLTNERLEGDELFLLYATPPCQGMSTNGHGRLKWEISQGHRDEEDPRNRLIIPTVQIIKKLKPRWILLENVPRMKGTAIRDDLGHTVNIIEYVSHQLGRDYVGSAQVVACEDFGIPQKRERLITIFTRDPNGKEYFRNSGRSFITPVLREPRKTLRDAIGDLPPLDARPGKNSRTDFHRYHYVAALNDEKYWWVNNTPEGDTAFNNQCSNPKCRFQGNRKHRDEMSGGKWTASKSTPILCEKCGELLPRPSIREDDGSRRLLKGFHSAYRRMKWDEPARTLTQNFIYEASDNKLHPEQNRVLSVYEALILQTINLYQFKFEIDGKDIGRARIAEAIGESVPPYLIEKLCRMMLGVSFSTQAARRGRESNVSTSSAVCDGKALTPTARKRT